MYIFVLVYLKLINLIIFFNYNIFTSNNKVLITNLELMFETNDTFIGLGIYYLREIFKYQLFKSIYIIKISILADFYSTYFEKIIYWSMFLNKYSLNNINYNILLSLEVF